MTLDLLFLNLTLLGAVKPQEQVFNMTVLPTFPLINLVPLQPKFQDDKFQGRWYTIAMADSRIRSRKQKGLNMQRVTFLLSDGHSYVVITTMIRGRSCDHWTRVFFPADLPGNFVQNTISGHRGVQRYTMRVVDTNYDQFALVSFTQEFQDRVYLYLSLYGRTKELSPRLKERFVHFAKFLGFTEDNIIFHSPTEKCISD
ncbi:neutrophil gelatinase-associated lipocalin-like [Cavia porcellus]|uniref:neutrophil gelatinase-associated lipocalin-like n=1 Tax=Cavia porcellus TaxID=10141 RepID=UPI000184E424